SGRRVTHLHNAIGDYRDFDPNATSEPLVLHTDLAAAIARAEALERERDALRAFAQDVMEDWNEGDLDGGTRQDLAERHGLIASIERFAPCGEECGCSEFFTARDWEQGQQCYRMTSLLTGKPESDAAIAAQQAEGE